MTYIANYNPTLRQGNDELTWKELDDNFTGVENNLVTISLAFDNVANRLVTLEAAAGIVSVVPIQNLSQLLDVNVSGSATGNFLSYDGLKWSSVNSPMLTSLSFTSGTGVLTAVSAAATVTTNLDGRYIRSVNGVTGDAAGNVVVSAGGTSGAPLDSPNLTGNATLTSGNAAAALTITQTGTGNALTVNDSISDLTPFVITGDGKVGVGKAVPTVELDVNGVINAGTGLQIAGVLVTPTAAELNFVDGVTSPIQTQLNNKAPKDSPVFTTSVTLNGPLNLGATTPGTAGQILTSAGPGLTPIWGSAAAPTSNGINIQVFTTSGTWTKPTGLPTGAFTVVELWGGGGGGARSSDITGAGGGGAYATRMFDTSSLGTTVTITVGEGGTGRTGSTGNGNNGGNSLFGSIITAYGGGGGNTSGQSGGGGGGELSAGNRDVRGRIGGGASDGGDAVTIYAGGGGGGDAGRAGGWAVWGGGGGSVVGNSVGLSLYGGTGGSGSNPGVAPAGGGGSNNNANGGSGARGEVRITTYW